MVKDPGFVYSLKIRTLADLKLNKLKAASAGVCTV